MESKGGKKDSSSSKSSFYEAPLGYSIEDVRPHSGIKKFRSAAYSNVSFTLCFLVHGFPGLFCIDPLLILSYIVLCAVRSEAILSCVKYRHNPVLLGRLVNALVAQEESTQKLLVRRIQVLRRGNLLVWILVTVTVLVCPYKFFPCQTCCHQRGRIWNIGWIWNLNKVVYIFFYY